MEIPDLNELKAEYVGKNVEFLAITFDQKDQVSGFLQKNPFDFQILPNAQEIIGVYGVQGFPTSVVIDKEGFKYARWEQLDRKEKDYWRGRVQQWNQDRVTPNMQYSPHPHHSS